MSISLPVDFFAYIAVFSLLISLIIGMYFRKVSVDFIEAKMAEDGKSSPLWDKGIGARIGAYAVLLVTGRASKQSIIDDYAILEHARKKDRRIAFFFLVTFSVSMLFFALDYIVTT